LNYNESICIIEALLFASGEPISLDRLSEASGIEPETVVKLIDRLERKYNVSDSAIRVLRLENSYQLDKRRICTLYKACNGKQASGKAFPCGT